MKTKLFSQIKQLADLVGYRILRSDQVGMEAIRDLQRWTRNPEPVIFDVGANQGQSLAKFSKAFPGAVIHCFEPSVSTFQELCKAAAINPRAYCWNMGLGNSEGSATFYENPESVLSSFLKPDPASWIPAASPKSAPIGTVDQFCSDHGIASIDILKSDTQGYDYAVFQGAARMFSDRCIRAVYFEVNFRNLYEGQGLFGQQYDLLTRYGYRFVALYQIFRDAAGLAEWTDALFVLGDS